MNMIGIGMEIWRVRDSVLRNIELKLNSGGSMLADELKIAPKIAFVVTFESHSALQRLVGTSCLFTEIAFSL